MSRPRTLRTPGCRAAVWRSPCRLRRSARVWSSAHLIQARSRASHAPDRQRHVDFSSRSYGTAHLDPAAMALDDAFRDRQAEAAAAGRDVAAAIKAFEDTREILASDPGASIPDRQGDLPGCCRARHRQMLLGRRVLDRVVHDVLERLDDRGTIDAYLWKIGWYVDDEIELAVGEHRS